MPEQKKHPGFWTYKTDRPTPTLAEAIEAKAVRPDTTETEWNRMSPGMKREIMRGKVTASHRWI